LPSGRAISTVRPSSLTRIHPGVLHAMALALAVRDRTARGCGL